ncbi:IS3 family transposase [Mesorhizobium sp. M0437]|uniref:IS3 family transposase n=1 Tax=Mesorhizobium sp. M0437 TaxID=2956945 RepID=UPI00333A2579
MAFIDDHRKAHGVEPICKVLPIAPSTYHDHVAKRVDPCRLSARARWDTASKDEVRRFEANFRVYGIRKVWLRLRREGFEVARCTVARLMKAMGLEGIVRGKPIRTTVSDKAAPCPLDHVNRQFHAPAPNMLRVSDFTCVATWTGFVYVAFVDTYARRIVGWRVSRTAHAAFVLDALEQALHDRRPARGGGLIHHSDRGSQGGFNRIVATPASYCPPRSWSRSSAGVFQPSVLRGLVLIAWATASSSRAVCRLRSVPFGKYCLSKPLVFSLESRCHGLGDRRSKSRARCRCAGRLLRHFRSMVPSQRLTQLLGKFAHGSGYGSADCFSAVAGKWWTVLDAQALLIARHARQVKHAL